MSEIRVDTISEKTSANGVAVDGVTLKDNKVTANGGLVADNITIDGTEIDLSSGDLTLDVAGDINLDAGGSDISLKGSGAEYGKFNLSGNSLNIHSSISDGDIVFKGSDGGSAITALTLDMSTGGQLLANPLGVSVPSYSFAGDSNTGMTRPTSDTIQFVTAGAEVFRITSAGIHIGGTGSANALDDYEEGTWTPVIAADAGAGAYASQVGVYTKIGRQVTVIFTIQISTIGSFSGASIIVSGLPFASGDLSTHTFGTLFLDGTASAVQAAGDVGIKLSNNTSAATFQGNSGNTSGDNNINANVIDTGTVIHGTITYFTG